MLLPNRASTETMDLGTDREKVTPNLPGLNTVHAEEKQNTSQDWRRLGWRILLWRLLDNHQACWIYLGVFLGQSLLSRYGAKKIPSASCGAVCFVVVLILFNDVR